MDMNRIKDSLHLLIFKTFRAQRNKIRPKLSVIGLSVGQPKVLQYLSEHTECMQKDLANYCDVEPATISKMLDTMEKNGLVKREDRKENRRAFRIVLTEEGELRLAAWEEICRSVDAVSLNGFTPEEERQFKDYLCRMYENLTGKVLE